MKCNEFRPGFELVSPCLFPTTITTTPRAPPNNFSNDISAKVNVITLLEFELAYFEAVVPFFSNYASGTLTDII